MAQLGARFHGMEEVDGSNPSRSTKLFKYLPLYSLQILFCGVQLEAKTQLMHGHHGHRTGFDAAHDWVFILNGIQ